MYFTVFLVETKEYVVIPKNWIQNIDGILWTQIVNYGIKKHKKYICYFSTRENALLNDQGKPNSEYPPNFDAPRADKFPCKDGTFVCRLLHYSSKLHLIPRHSIKFLIFLCFRFFFFLLIGNFETVGHLRDSFYKPNSVLNIVSTTDGQYNDAAASTSSTSIPSGRQNETIALDSNDVVAIQSGIESEPSASSSNRAFSGELTSSSLDENNIVEVKIEGRKQRLEIFKPSEEAMSRIDALIDREDDSEDEEDDGVIYIDEGKPLPAPLHYTIDYLMKRENDAISGNLAFNEHVCFNHTLKISF